MFATGAFALVLTDAAFGMPPPIRPQRPARRPRPGAGIAGAIRHLRTQLARGMADGSGLPPVTRNYPY